MKAVVIVIFCFSCLQLQAQRYSTANLHSHNDYEQPVPFFAAWRAGFGSIEADIFLANGKLIVAHDTVELKKGYTLDSLYLLPLQEGIKANRGSVYPDPRRELILLVDIKTAATATLEKLVEKLKAYPVLTTTPSLKIVISGNRPLATDFTHWPAWMYFDGDLKVDYTKEQLSRIGLFSDNFSRYSKWKGQEELAAHERFSIDSIVRKVHVLGKKIRFWNAPDMANSWRTFMDLNIDYINTDHIEALAGFLQKNSTGSQ